MRGRRLLKDELKRLTREVLVPADLVDSTTGAGADESVSLEKWRDSARIQVRLNGAEKRASDLRKLSSLSLLVDNGTDYSTPFAHPYTSSVDGRAASLWFKVRSNTLPLGRLLAKSNRGVSDVCKCCKKSVREDLAHFLCDCPGLRTVRSTWLRSLKAEHPESKLTLKDIPKLVLGPASALDSLPHSSLLLGVEAVETLLTNLWRARNALHFGSREAGRKRQPLKITRPSHGGTRERPGESRTDTSNDSHRSNANSGIESANGRLTRARTRMLSQRAQPSTERPCQSMSTPRVSKQTSTATDRENARAPRV